MPSVLSKYVDPQTLVIGQLVIWRRQLLQLLMGRLTRRSLFSSKTLTASLLMSTLSCRFIPLDIRKRVLLPLVQLVFKVVPTSLLTFLFTSDVLYSYMPKAATQNYANIRTQQGIIVCMLCYFYCEHKKFLTPSYQKFVVGLTGPSTTVAQVTRKDVTNFTGYRWHCDRKTFVKHLKTTTNVTVKSIFPSQLIIACLRRMSIPTSSQLWEVLSLTAYCIGLGTCGNIAIQYWHTRTTRHAWAMRCGLSLLYCFFGPFYVNMSNYRRLTVFMWSQIVEGFFTWSGAEKFALPLMIFLSFSGFKLNSVQSFCEKLMCLEDEEDEVKKAETKRLPTSPSNSSIISTSAPSRIQRTDSSHGQGSPGHKRGNSALSNLAPIQQAVSGAQ